MVKILCDLCKSELNISTKGANLTIEPFSGVNTESFLKAGPDNYTINFLMCDACKHKIQDYLMGLMIEEEFND